MRKLTTKGQSLVEFALIIPLVIFAITVFLDVGRAVYSYSALSHAVREGTRYAVVHSLKNSTEAAVVEQVVKNSAVGLNPSKMTVTITPVPPVAPDYKVTIHADYEFNSVTPGLALLLGSGNKIILKARSSMEVAPLYRE